MDQPEAVKARRAAAQRRYAERNREKVLAAARAWRAANPERVREHNAAVYTSDPNKHRRRCAEYKRRRADVTAAHIAARRARKLQQCPSWADQDAIKAVYATCASTTAATGELHHVDHIVPLKGRSVSGLHVPWNLQVIPASENLSKGNRLVA